MAKKCLKCGYLNELAVIAQDSSCPECGAVYSKLEARISHYASVASVPNIESERVGELSRSSAKKIILYVLAALAVGYMLGRAHMQYEVRKAFEPFAELANSAGGQRYPLWPVTPPKKPNDAGWFAQDSIIEATLVDKQFLDADPYNGMFKDQVSYQIAFENSEGKAIRAFSGVIGLYDLLDNPITSFNVSVNEPITPYGKLEWAALVPYHAFSPSHTLARNAAIQNIKTTFKLTKVLYEDGATEEFND